MGPRGPSLRGTGNEPRPQANARVGIRNHQQCWLYPIRVTNDEIPKLDDWLAQYRGRPEPVEIVVASYDLPKPVADDPVHGMSAGQTGIDIVRYEATGRPGPPDNSHYVMGVDSRGQHTSDDWYETEGDARGAIESGHYGPVVERQHNSG